MESELLKELALQLYREGLVSSAGACQVAGLMKSILLKKSLGSFS
jgi:predicted HTH domain antitoxin